MSNYPCPACGAPASLDGGCPACGLAPDPVAAEVAALDEEIRHQGEAIAAARQAMNEARQRRNALAAEVRARTAWIGAAARNSGVRVGAPATPDAPTDPARDPANRAVAAPAPVDTEPVAATESASSTAVATATGETAGNDPTPAGSANGTAGSANGLGGSRNGSAGSGNGRSHAGKGRPGRNGKGRRSNRGRNNRPKAAGLTTATAAPATAAPATGAPTAPPRPEATIAATVAAGSGAAPSTASPSVASPSVGSPAPTRPPRAAAPPPTAPPPTAPRRPAAPRAVRRPPRDWGAPRRRAVAALRRHRRALVRTAGIVSAVVLVVAFGAAWVVSGTNVRAALVGAVTAAVLSAPVLAIRRGRVAVAEVLVALGVAVMAADGVTAWYAGLVGSLDGATVAAVVAALSAAVAAAYGARTRLRVPGVVAIVAGQPVLPLLAVARDASVAGWGLTLSVLAAADLLVLWRRPRARTALRRLLWTMYGVAVTAAVACALQAELTATDAGTVVAAGIALVAAAGVFLAGMLVTRDRVAGGIGVATAALALVAAAGTVGSAYAPDGVVLLPPVVAIALVALATLAVPPSHRFAARIGAGIAVGAMGAGVAALALWSAVRTVTVALPPWHADLDAYASQVPVFDAQLPVSVVLLALGGLALLPRGGRLPVLVTTGVIVAFALPASVPLGWLAPSLVDIAVAVPLAVLATRTRGAGTWLLRVATVVLLGHAALTGLARPSATAVWLWALVALGTVLVVRGAVRVGLAALALLPVAAHATAVAAGAGPATVARGTLLLAAVAVGAAYVVRSRSREHLGAAVVAAAAATVYGTVVLAGRAGEPAGVYGAAGLLLVATLALMMSTVDRRTAWLGVFALPPAIWAGIVAVPVLVATYAVPYAWLGDAWSGRPVAGPGLDPDGGLPGHMADVLAVWLLVLAAAVLGAIGGRTVARRRQAALRREAATADTVGTSIAYGMNHLPHATRRGAVVALVAGATLGLPVTAGVQDLRWPAVPVLMLVLGLLAALVAGRNWLGAGPWRRRTATGLAIVLCGAGVAALLPLAVTTLAGLGAVLLTGILLGARGRTLAAHVGGWLAAITAGVLLSIAGPLYAELPLRTSAYAVLAAGALTLMGGGLLRIGVDPHVGFEDELAPELPPAARRAARIEAGAVDAAAHASAVVAVLLVSALFGSGTPIQHTAAMVALWGSAVAMRALWPGESLSRRRGLAVAAAGCELVGWWLLLGARGIELLEAYTLPAAAVAFGAGWLALRMRPALPIWAAYGPALAIAFLPSVGAILVQDGRPVRLLLLAAVAMTVALGVAIRRRRRRHLIA